MAIMKTDLDALVREVTAAGSHLRGPEAETWAAQLDRDHDRIQQGLAWLLENDPTAGLELALALPDYWHLRGQWAEGRGWLERLLAAVRDPTPTLRCRALSSRSGLAFRLGDVDAAVRLWRESLALAHQTENRYLLPYPVAGLGEAAAAQRDWDRAARLLGAASGLFKASGAAIDPADVPAYDAAVAATRAGLTVAFERAWSSGESMSADEIVAFA